MIMLYALSIEKYDGQRIERITIKIKNIDEIYRIENMNDKRIDFLRIFQENLVGMDRNENLSFLEDMNYIGNSAVSINNIFDSIESIISLTS